MQLDFIKYFEDALRAEIVKKSMELGTTPFSERGYVYAVGRNSGLSDAIEIIKNVAAGLMDEDLSE